ncbi:MAG: tetratricopeptide repeat protein [Verrucomicrobia bacterium]|nr:tetratricopeptide repeat protein [Verrucomicrobiota bacterium]
MKKLIAIILLGLVIAPACMAWWLFPENTSADAQAIDALSLRKKAYDAAQQGRPAESAVNFRSYLAARPADAQATFDYAVLLASLGRHDEAVPLLESLHRMNPAREAAYFKLGVEYVLLQRDADAEKVFTELQSSGNRDVALAAAEAASRLKADQARAAKYKAESEVYALAREFKHEEVVAAVDALEKQWPLGFEMEMQRLYAMQNLQKYAPALLRADELAGRYPKATDLALLRADLLMQLGRKDEAVAIWQRVLSENPGTSAAITANNRLEEVHKQDAAVAVATAPIEPVKVSAEEIIYNLAGKQKYKEVVAAIDELEKQRGTLSWDMELQRLYSLQSLGQTDRAIQVGEKMAQSRPQSVEVAFLRADLLVSAHRWEDSSVILKKIKDENKDTAAATEAKRRLTALPGMCNVDKQQWGEMYLSGDYHERYDTVIGSGFIREGTSVPHARRLQPYVGAQLSVDTKSGAGVQQTIVADNSVSFVGGVRAQPFPTQYLFLYAEAGINKDLLDRRNNGDWAWDWQAGIYGFKSWGPGVKFKDYASTNAPVDAEDVKCPFSYSPMWRGDWFADVGADFSWYQRHDSWLGYGQAHEGFRLVQFGPKMALDAYAVENVAWDVRGNYFDNLFEIGPGARLIWEPRRGWQVVLKAEWIEGYYFGRDDLNIRGGAAGSYDDFRVSLSVGASW